MTPHFIATLIIAAILYASATLLLLRAYGATEGAAAPTPATQPVQTAQHRDLQAVQMQGITTALMDIGRPVTRNPYPPGSQARAVWFGGYVMAQARAREQATPSTQRGRA